MSFPVFYTGDDYAPALGLDGKHEFKTEEAEFGEGYEQIVQDGLNSHRQTWSVTWDNVDIATVGANIKSFLDARGSHEVFTWTKPDGTTINVRMAKSGYNEVFDYAQNVVTISTVFRQAFEV